MYADKHTVVYPTKIKHKVFMVTCSLVEELKMKKKKIFLNRIYANLFAYKRVSDICKSDAQISYKRVFVYMQLGYMQTILPVPSTCIYPSSTVYIYIFARTRTHTHTHTRARVPVLIEDKLGYLILYALKLIRFVVRNTSKNGITIV